MSSGLDVFQKPLRQRSQDEAVPALPGQDGVPRLSMSAERAAAARRRPSAVARPNGTLDSVGQKNELIRVRFAN